jgi:hypothetical protein
MKESEIIQAIDKKVITYRLWTIDITEDPKQRKEQHGNPEHWADWKADSETIARNVEKYFIDKGMKGGTGGGDHPTYVYTF